VAQWTVKMSLGEGSNRVFLPELRGQQGSAVICSCHLLLFDSLSAANLAITVLGCCFRPILSCSLRLTKYLNNHLITSLSVGAPVFHHAMIMVRLTSPRIPQVEGYGLNLGFDGHALTSCHRRRASLSPRAYPKILLRLF
jgi:hypothetical protein